MVSFLKRSEKEEKLDCLNSFIDIQKNTILKSEIVEKNDGKATFILKRLFEAYVTNPHQLPDYSLRIILIDLKNKEDQFLQSADETFIELIRYKVLLNEYLKTTKKITIEKTKKLSDDLSEILRKIIMHFKTMSKDEYDSFKKELEGNKKLNNALEIVDIMKAHEDYALIGSISNIEHSDTLDNLIKKYTDCIDEINKIKFPREIKDLFKKRKDLDIFLFSLNISRLMSNDDNDGYVKNQIRVFRAIIDNAVLNAIPLWKSILTRGICDYIAGLTDQEAIDEYEKLYAGIMELV